MPESSESHIANLQISKSPNLQIRLDMPTSKSDISAVKREFLPLALLTVAVIAFRLLGASFPETLPNFQPLMALVLCSFVFLKGVQRWIPLAAWAVTDPFVSYLQGYPLIGWHHLGMLLGIAAVIGLAFLVRRRKSAGSLLLGTVAAAFAFYFLSNTVAFFGDFAGIYPNTLEGFVQAQWTGPAHLGPTWIFLRNTLGSNLLFTGLVLLAYSLPVFAARPVLQPAPAKV
jgi:hypothetical protein